MSNTLTTRISATTVAVIVVLALFLCMAWLWGSNYVKRDPELIKPVIRENSLRVPFGVDGYQEHEPRKFISRRYPLSGVQRV